jgi:hypothetical protein
MLAATMGAHQEALVPVEPVHALEVHHEAFAAEQQPEAHIPETRPGGR